MVANTLSLPMEEENIENCQPFNVLVGKQM
jgi:hypothetical protein